MIGPYLPYPPDLALRLRTWHLVSRLNALADVTLVSWVGDNDASESLEKVRAATADAVLLPLQRAPMTHRARLFRQLRFLAVGAPPPYVQAMIEERDLAPGRSGRSRFIEEISGRHRQHPFDVVVLEDEGVSEYPVPQLGIPVAVHRVQLFDEAVAEVRKGAASGGLVGQNLWRLVRAIERRRWRAFDRRVSAPAVLSLAVTPEVAEGIRKLVPSAEVKVVTNGVGLRALRTSPRQGRDIVFVGWMRYAPNVDAVVWFASAVWPEVHRRHPDAVLRIIGREPSPAVLALERKGIHVVGEVADVPDACEGARAGVVPLRAGRGIKNKTLELMSMGLPVVASPAGAEGIRARPADGLLEVATASAVVAALDELLNDGDRASQLGAAARSFVEHHFTWDEQANCLLEALRSLTRQEAPNGPANA